AERLTDPAEGHALLGRHSAQTSVDAARIGDCNCPRPFSKLCRVRVARLLALTMTLLACSAPGNAPAASPAPSASASGLVLAAGTYRLPAASAFGEPGFHEASTIRASVPVALAPGAGRTLVVRLHDSSRPGQTCSADHPLSGCATVDWSDSPDRPKVPGRRRVRQQPDTAPGRRTNNPVSVRRWSAGLAPRGVRSRMTALSGGRVRPRVEGKAALRPGPGRAHPSAGHDQVLLSSPTT